MWPPASRPSPGSPTASASPSCPGSGPGLKGAAAQAKAFKAFKERKESGYVTSQAQYRHWDSHLPMGRVPHLLVMDIATGRVRDLFEGTPFELVRSDPDRNCLRHLARRPTHRLRLRPRAREAGRQLLRAGRDRDSRALRVRELARDAGWDMGAPRYSPDGERIAFLASHQGQKHTMPAQLCVWERENGRWSVESGEWDHEVHRPAAVGRRRPGAALRRRAARVASTCGASTCPTGAPSCWCTAAVSAPSTSAPARW